ncbi:MAG: phosphoglycerate kinase [Elusimicrobia bacterium]|nr:phosphoglycerate kinase [Elusimicrobiota bacterium]
MKKIADLDVEGKKVLVRCDFNVPLKGAAVQDDTRIVEALPTIKALLERRAAVILMSHLGRPDGKAVPEYSLRPVSERLSQLLGREVKFAEDTIGDSAKKLASGLKPGEILLLENLRFNPGEEGNDPGFARSLASMGELFVQDAFGTVHRKHASMVGVPGILPSAAGLLLQKEIEYLSKGLNPERPLLVCLGGAKLETKIPIIENMLEKADTILIGGGMAYTLLKSQGKKVGRSIVDENNISTAENILKKAREKSVDLQLPSDHIATDDFKDPKKIEQTGDDEIPGDLIGVDIAAKTVDKYIKSIMKAKTIVLNGPMGVFEKDEFASGTRRILEAVIESTRKGASSIVGGGDTVSAIENLGFSKDGFSHVSTGGGASLKFLEGKALPGIKVLG